MCTHTPSLSLALALTPRRVAVTFGTCVDVAQAVYEVDDLDNAIQNTAQSQLKEVFGKMNFREALVSQNYINTHMRQSFSFSFEKWGLRVERIELQAITPKRSSDTTQFMKKQMIAERMRRADFITAEGSKTAMRLTSEGTKLVKFNLGVAEQVCACLCACVFVWVYLVYV